MEVTVANPTPASRRIEYYAEFTHNNITYNCEFYRDGTRQIFKHSEKPTRRVKGNPFINNTLDEMFKDKVIV